MSQVTLDTTPAAPGTRIETPSVLAETVIRPASACQLLGMSELWRYRDLVLMLVLRDIKVKFNQTATGVRWAVIQLVLTEAIFGVLFGLMKGGAASGDVLYAVTSMCGIVAWSSFASTVRVSTQLLVANKDIITKLYSPRIILPFTVMLGGLIDFAIAFAVFLLTMACFGVVPTLSVVCTHVFVVLILLTTMALSLWLSALNAIYRDVEYVIQFALQTGFFMQRVGVVRPALSWELDSQCRSNVH
jgi:lipopolysaccharide transport system permease protein